MKVLQAIWRRDRRLAAQTKQSRVPVPLPYSSRKTGWKGWPASISPHSSLDDGELGAFSYSHGHTSAHSSLAAFPLPRGLCHGGEGIQCAGMGLKAQDTFHQCAGHLYRRPNPWPSGVLETGTPSCPALPSLSGFLIHAPQVQSPCTAPPPRNLHTRRAVPNLESQSPPEQWHMAPFRPTAT